MNPKEDIPQITSLLGDARSGVVLVGNAATHDTTAAALAMHLSLVAAGKQVTIASPKQTTVELSNLIAVDKIANTLGNKNFVISLDYPEDSIEKVSYHVDEGTFNLVIEPRENAPQINKDNISYQYSGFSAQIIFVVGTQSLEQLGNFYTQNKTVFADTPVVVIDTQLNNQRFGRHNIVRTAPSVSELMLATLTELQLPINEDVATNLYQGIESATNTFSAPQVTAQTFETVAQLLKRGAKRNWGKRQPGKQQDLSALYKKQEERPQRETQTRGVEAKEGAPPDWLKPKIFRGSTSSS